jgi:hypothetical protein
MITNPRLAPTEASIDAVDPEELKFALAFREAVFTGQTPPDKSTEWFGAQNAEFCFPDTPRNRPARALRVRPRKVFLPHDPHGALVLAAGVGASEGMGKHRGQQRWDS